MCRFLWGSPDKNIINKQHKTNTAVNEAPYKVEHSIKKARLFNVSLVRWARPYRGLGGEGFFFLFLLFLQRNAKEGE